MKNKEPRNLEQLKADLGKALQSEEMLGFISDLDRREKLLLEKFIKDNSDELAELFGITRL